MKILWLSHLVPYPPKGGVLQRAYHMLRQAATSHTVHLVAFVQKDLLKVHSQDPDRVPEEFKRGLEFCESMDFIDVPVDESVFGKPGLALRSLLSRYPYTINWLVSGKYADALSGVLKRVDVDLVHFDTISLAVYRPLIGDLPATLDHHNVESQMMLRRSRKEESLLKRCYFRQEGLRLRRFEARECRYYGSNLMCSELDAKRLQAVCPGAITDVIPNGVDLEYFTGVEHSPDPRRCTFVGRLNAYTNSQAVRFIARELWPRLRAEVPGVRFDIVGSSPPQDVVSVGEADPDFQVTGYVEDVRPYLESSGIFVCPMFDGAGTRLKILDAMAMGKPIVATRLAVEGISIVDGKSALLAETAEEFVAAVRRLVQDPSFASRLGKEARRIVENEYSYDSIGERLLRTFERVVATHGRPTTGSL